ncbi:hypothetical protein [Endozoicomonas sp. ONNA1]|uniref:hypothetical protein n=1 Tax=Endozoicomonas sp. ONNA1 TaxID=2828740 RepID=UPI0021490F70|nr:hypothetical protein [Endozoicomonas sp. ONNA1]
MSVMIISPCVYFDCIRTLGSIAVDDRMGMLKYYVKGKNELGFDAYTRNENNRLFNGIERLMSAIFVENYRAYVRRYNEKETGMMSFKLSDYTEGRSLGLAGEKVSVWQLLKSLHSIIYQIDHESRSKKALSALIREIEQHLIYNSEEYNSARWG